MLNFRRYVHLWEGRIDFLKRSIGEINSSHDINGEHRDTDKIIDHFAEKSDPSANKQYTQWIVNKYKTKVGKDGSVTPGQFRQEDHGRIRSALERFEEHKSKLPHQDINRYKSLHELEDAIEPHLGTKREISGKEQERIDKATGADRIYENPNVSVTHLKDHSAAKLYAAGTKWCTSRKSMFDVYNDQGPIYVIHDKREGKKYQLHLPTEQFMNESDRPANLEEITKKYPQLKNIDHYKNSAVSSLRLGQHLIKPEEKQSIIDRVIKSGTVEEKKKLGETIPETLDKLSEDPNHEVRKNSVTWNVPHSILDKLMKDPHEEVRKAVASKSSKHAGMMLEDPSKEVQKQIINSHDKHLPYYTEHSDKELRSLAIVKSLENGTSKITDKIANEHIPDHKLARYYHRLSPELQKKALDSITPATDLDRWGAESEDIIKKLVKTNNPSLEHLMGTHGDIIASSTSSVPLLKKILIKNKEHYGIYSSKIFNKLLSVDKKNTQNHIDSIFEKHPNMNDRNYNSMGIITKTNNPDHHLRFLENEENHKSLFNNPHVSDSIKKGIIKNAIDKEKGWINQKTSVLAHVTNTEDLDKMWKERHNSATYLIKNQKFIHAIHDHPHVSEKTKAAAAALIEKYKPSNEEWAKREKPKRINWRQERLNSYNQE